jgi:hypothetical protein
MVRRMTAIDPTVVIERMAGRLRADGAQHPVAAALAIAARGHARLAPEEYAASVDLPIGLVDSAETGDVAFSDLPSTVGEQAGAMGIDLLALVDLEATWRTDPPIQAAGR